MESYGPELNRIRSLLKSSAKGLTVTEISRNIEINRNSVAKYLDVLLSQGQVEMKVVGSAKVFSLTKRIPISSILSLSSDYIIVLDDDFVVTYVNDNVVNFEKKSFDEIVGKPLDHMPVSFLSVPDAMSMLKDGISGKEFLRELEITNDNKTYFFRAKFVPSILENRKKGLLIILEDVTEIKQYQQHLENTVAIRDVELTTTHQNLDQEIKSHQEVSEAFTESERRYSKLIELAQEGVLTFNPEGMITFVNKKCSEILGYTQDDMQGSSIFSYTDETNTSLLKKNVGRLKTGKTGHFELVFLRKDHSAVFTLLSASPSLNEHGTFLYGLFLVSDITELKKTDSALRESELHYRTLIETSPNGIIRIDPDGGIITANLQAIKMLGYKKPAELIGKNLFDYIAPNDLEKVHTNLNNATERGSVKNTECTLISNENCAFCADLNISITRESTVSPTSCVCVISDITERRKAEYLVRKSEEKNKSYYFYD
jgi:PAS domain S-box-containing protein